MKQQILPLVLVLASVLPASAAPSVKKPWMKLVTKESPGPNLKIRPLSLSYRMSWNGVLNSGPFHFILGKPDSRYPRQFLAQAYGKSTGLAAKLYPYKFNYVAFLRKNNYRPILFVGSETDKKGKKVTTNRYKASGSHSKEVKIRKGRAPSTTVRSFPRRRVYDLMSAMLYIRSLNLRPGSTKAVVVHPFKTPYLVRAKVLGKERHLGRPSIKLKVSIQKIAPDMSLLSYKKMKTAVLWLSDDAERIPLELRVKAFIGSVRATITGKRYL